MQTLGVVTNMTVEYGNPCGMIDDVWETTGYSRDGMPYCPLECFEMVTKLADHGCYSLFLAYLRRMDAQHQEATKALDDAYYAKYRRARPTRDDLPSIGGQKLWALGILQSVCFDSLLVRCGLCSQREQ